MGLNPSYSPHEMHIAHRAFACSFRPTSIALGRAFDCNMQCTAGSAPVPEPFTHSVTPHAHQAYAALNALPSLPLNIHHAGAHDFFGMLAHSEKPLTPLFFIPVNS